jgi:hypothetical protein
MKSLLLPPITLFFILGLCPFALGADTNLSADTQAKIQMHEHMSDMHQKAALCLKSGKTEKECHESMMAECQQHDKMMKGQMGCSMMGDMGKVHQPMHGKMKMDDKSESEDHSAHHSSE